MHGGSIRGCFFDSLDSGRRTSCRRPLPRSARCYSAAGLRGDHARAQAVAGEHLGDARERRDRVGRPVVHQDDLTVGELAVGLHDPVDAERRSSRRC